MKSKGIEFFKSNLFYVGHPYYNKETKQDDVLVGFDHHLADDLLGRPRRKHSSMKSDIFVQVYKSRITWTCLNISHIVSDLYQSSI